MHYICQSVANRTVDRKSKYRYILEERSQEEGEYIKNKTGGK